MWCTPVHMLCPPLGSHVRHVFVAEMTEEETSIRQVNRLGSRCFSVQLVLQLQGQCLITVRWLQVKVGAEGLWRTSWD